VIPDDPAGAASSWETDEDATVLRPAAASAPHGAPDDPDDGTVLRADVRRGAAEEPSSDDDDRTVLRPAVSSDPVATDDAGDDDADDGTVLRPGSPPVDPDDGTVLRPGAPRAGGADDATVLRPGVAPGAGDDPDDDGTVLRGGPGRAGRLPQRDAATVAQMSEPAVPAVPTTDRRAYVPSVVASSVGHERYAPRTDQEPVTAVRQDFGRPAARSGGTGTTEPVAARRRRSRRTWTVALVVVGVVVVGALALIGVLSGVL